MPNKKKNKQAKQPPKPIHFAVLTKDYLERKEVEVEKLVVSDEDDEIQMHDILKKWKTDDAPPTAPIKPVQPVELEPDPKLESGSKLANRLKIDDSLIGIPLEDIDPFYRKSRSTFVVIGRDRNLTRFSATDALFAFSPFSPFRRAALYVLVHPIFSLLVILTILCNCVFMAMTSPPEVAEYVFTAVYTLEAVIKVLARGFFLAPFTYIRDAWNILDFVVITLAYITSFVNLGNLSILRTFRVLRALKTVAIVPGLKTIVGALLEAVRRLRDVAVLTLFMLSIFALIGLQLYMGQLSHKCVKEMPGYNTSDVSTEKAEPTKGVVGPHIIGVQIDPLFHADLDARLPSEPSPVAMLEPVIEAKRATKRKRRSLVISYVNYDNFSSFILQPGDKVTETRYSGVVVSLTSGSNLPPVSEPVFINDYMTEPLDPKTATKEHGHSSTADDTEKDNWLHNPDNWLADKEGGYAVCGIGKCPNGYLCVSHLGDNPDYGYTSFDNFGWAMFGAFRLMTQDAWERLFHQVITASGTYHVIYFVLVIFLGSFYLINLILAIVAMSYQDLQTEEEEAAAQERQAEAAERGVPPENVDDFEMLNPETSPIPADPGVTDTPRLSVHEPPEDRQLSIVRRESHQSIDVGTIHGSAKLPIKHRHLERQAAYSRRSSWTIATGGELAATRNRRSSSRNNSGSVTPSIARGSLRQRTGRPGELSFRVSLPYLDDSEALTPTSEMLNNFDFHIADYVAALQQMSDIPPPVDSTTDAQLIPWRLAALQRGSISIEDEAITTGPPEVAMENLRQQLGQRRSAQSAQRKLERRPAVDDSSIHAIDIFSATPRRYRRFKIPMMDESIGESVRSSRMSLQSETFQQLPDNSVSEQQEDIVITMEENEEQQPPDELPPPVEPLCFTAIRYCWNSRAHQLFEMFVNDPFVDLFITLCIVVNTLFMALDHYGMSHIFEERLKQGNYFFTAVFATECAMKIVALSPCKYFTDAWNVFDSFIVFLSLVELGLEGVQGLSVLRTFRLLRVFKLARSWPTLNLLIAIIGRTLGALGNLTFVLGIIVFIFAVMGMQLFGKSYRQNIDRFPDSELPRWHFEDFTHSFMIVFRVLCGEWVESTWDCMLVYGWPCIPFFVLTLVVGNLVVLNLFLALLLDSFSSENIQSILEEKVNEPNKLAEALDRFSRFYAFLKVQFARILRIRLRDKRLDVQSIESVISAFAKRRLQHGETEENREEESPQHTSSHQQSTPSHIIRVVCDEQGGVVKSSTLPSIRPHADISLALSRRRTNTSMSLNVGDCCPNCWYRRFPAINRLMSRRAGIAFNKFRCKATEFVEHKYFETTVIILIVISSLALAIEDVNTRQNKTLMAVLEIMDKCFSVIFAAEMILKWLALGFRRYFSDGWCWLDFVIVTVSIISWIAEGAGLGNLGAFRALRTLRALRPLRAVSRWEGMKIVVNALLQAIPSICNVFLVCVVFWLIFSIMGVQLFAGKFHKCVDDDGNRLPVEKVANKTDCLLQNYTWTNSKINFDNVGRAYLSLFQVATFSGWIEIIADAVDVVEIDQQPFREASVYFYFYFVLFIIFGSFFTLNLFIGVIIENFNKQKKRSGGSIEMFMTDEQKKYYNAMKKLKNKSPQKPIPKPKFWLHAKLFSLVTDQRFDVFIMVIIMLNMLQMCLEHHEQPVLFTTILSYMNTVFIAIFTAEFVLKLIAFRCYYFTQPWNVFDCVVVVLSITASTLADYMADFPVSPTILRVVRVFRVGRVLRLVKSAKGIRTLLFSLAVSLPALFNIGLLLLLVIFIYGCFGMSFFMNVRLINGLNEQFNFQTIVNSVLLLFQLATSAGWDGTLLALMNDSPPGCDPTPTEFSPHGDCSNSTVAVIYLVSYIIISFMIVINMYIAVILENFGEATQDIQQGLTQDDFDAFFEKWERVDPTASQYIPISKLSSFVANLEPPLNIPMPNWRAIVILDPPICTDLRVHCDDVVTMLVRNAVAGSVSNAADAPELDLAAILSKEKPNYEVVAYLSQLDSAARRIQRKWRRRRRINVRRLQSVSPSQQTS